MIKGWLLQQISNDNIKCGIKKEEGERAKG